MCDVISPLAVSQRGFVEAAISDLMRLSLTIVHSHLVLIIPAWFCGGHNFVLREFPHDAGPFPFNFYHLSPLPHSHPYFSSSAFLFPISLHISCSFVSVFCFILEEGPHVARPPFFFLQRHSGVPHSSNVHYF
jgi:hypothetical protein